MPGSLRQRQPNVWELRVFLGRDAAGKVRHRSLTFRGGKRAAERELSRLRARGGPPGSGSVGKMLSSAGPRARSGST